MSTWQTPKTDWSPQPEAPGVKSEDFNRIEGNIEYIQEVLNQDFIAKKLITGNFAYGTEVIETGIPIDKIVGFYGIKESVDTSGEWVSIHYDEDNSTYYKMALRPNAEDSTLADIFFPSYPFFSNEPFRVIVSYMTNETPL